MKYLATITHFYFIFFSSTAELSALSRSETMFVAKLFLPAYSFVAVWQILRITFAKQKFAQLRTNYICRTLPTTFANKCSPCYEWNTFANKCSPCYEWNTFANKCSPCYEWNTFQEMITKRAGQFIPVPFTGTVADTQCPIHSHSASAETNKSIVSRKRNKHSWTQKCNLENMCQNTFITNSTASDLLVNKSATAWVVNWPYKWCTDHSIRLTRAFLQQPDERYTLTIQMLYRLLNRTVETCLYTSLQQPDER